MSTLLRDHANTVVVMDDILVFRKDKKDHNLRAVMQTIKASGLKLNKAKYQFGKSEIQYFGHITGIKSNPEKVRAIIKLPSPTNVTELHQMIGMINYLCKFFPDLLTVMHLINSLLKTDAVWIWRETQEQAFKQVKAMLTTAPVFPMGSHWSW